VPTCAATVLTGEGSGTLTKNPPENRTIAEARTRGDGGERGSAAAGFNPRKPRGRERGTETGGRWKDNTGVAYRKGTGTGGNASQLESCTARNTRTADQRPNHHSRQTGETEGEEGKQGKQQRRPHRGDVTDDATPRVCVWRWRRRREDQATTGRGERFTARIVHCTEHQNGRPTPQPPQQTDGGKRRRGGKQQRRRHRGDVTDDATPRVCVEMEETEEDQATTGWGERFTARTVHCTEHQNGRPTCNADGKWNGM